MKRQIEGLFAPQLVGRLEVHHHRFAAKGTFCHREWVTLDGEVIWDYPAPFTVGNEREQPHVDPRYFHYHHWGEYHWYTQQTIGSYLDAPRDELFGPLTGDHYGLGNILRAADRRIGFERLAWWAFMELRYAPPARRIMGVRFESRKPKARRG
jgi:hypothetical protein